LSEAVWTFKVRVRRNYALTKTVGDPDYDDILAFSFQHAPFLLPCADVCNRAHQINYLDPPKWIRWGDYPLSLLDADFLSKMNNEPDQLVGKVVEDVWQLFTELRSYMEEVNAAVVKMRWWLFRNGTRISAR
jgi:hypothetical protein